MDIRIGAKVVLFFFLLLATTGFAESLMLDNQTGYPMKNQKTRIVIQWGMSAKDIEAENYALMYGEKLNPDNMQTLTQSGKISLSIPDKAEYLRILVWSKEDEKEPDLHTNWVDVEPNKTYTLKADHLVPSVLMSGAGC